MKADGLQIARWMTAICSKLKSAGMEASDAKEMSFHMADVAEDLSALSAFIEKASGECPITVEELDAVLDRLEYHAYYHLKSLYRVARLSRLKAEKKQDQIRTSHAKLSTRDAKKNRKKRVRG